MQLEPVLETLVELIRIKSVNPNYVDGVSEAAIIRFIESFFSRRGISTRRQSVMDDRDNLIAIVPGRDRSRRLIFEAHVDTVSAEGMVIDPYRAVIQNGKMHGRGACDTKGGLASMMHALALIHQQGVIPPCDIWLVAAVDEEYSYRGVAKLCSDLEAESTVAAIVAEPTELRPVIASKGLVRWIIQTQGVAAHSAKPHLGKNAIDQMSHVIQAIAHDTKTLAESPHALLGPSTCNVGVIRGGVQVNLVPATCEIEIDRRMLPGENCEDVLAHYQSLLDAVMDSFPEVHAFMHPPMLTDVPLETPADSVVVQRMQRVLQSMDLDSELIGVPFGSDASKFGELGIPSLILGPGCIDQAHSDDEYIDCGQVIKACQLYYRLMLEIFSNL